MLALGDKFAEGEFTVFCENQDGEWKYDGFKTDDPNIEVELKPEGGKSDDGDLRRRGADEAERGCEGTGRLSLDDPHV